MPEIYGSMVNFTMFFPVFSLNFDGLRYPVKISRSHEIITHGCEIGLHPDSLHCCHHDMKEMEYTFHDGVRMFHR